MLRMRNYFSPLAQWLCCCFLFVCCMLAARIIYTNNIRYIFLVWNLFLAAIPYWISMSLYKMILKSKFLQSVFLLCWLVFFPNALYVVTDLIHLTKTTSVPVWFDAVLLFVSSSLGLVLGFASLLNVERYLCNYFKTFQVNLIVLSTIFAGSYGVYLGRFKRWNSWDVVNNPLLLATDILKTFIHPLEHLGVWSVVFLLTGMYSLSWFLIKVFTAQLNTLKSINPVK